MLVGGKGTRLRPLTLSAPKPLLPTAGVPFLAHQLAMAAECGITHVVLATSYRAEMFTEAFGDGAQFGLSIDYVYESEPLGTGGGIRNAAALLRGGPDEPIVVLNGDILSGHDLPAQVDLHRKKEAAVTLHLVPVDDPSRYGCVPTDVAGHVTAFLEKTPNPVTNQINAGCYVFRRSVIDQIPAGQVVSVERETFPGLIEAGAVVMGYAEAAYWLDVGTPEAFVRGSCDVVLGALPSPALPGAVGAFLVLGDAQRGRRRPADRRHHRRRGRRHRGRRGRRGQRDLRRRHHRGRRRGPQQHRRLPRHHRRHGDRRRRDRPRRGARRRGHRRRGYVGPGNELLKGLRVWPGTRIEPTSVRFSTDA